MPLSFGIHVHGATSNFNTKFIEDVVILNGRAEFRVGDLGQ